MSFDPTKPLISVKQGSGALWRIRNGGGGWVHPMHLHMEEHRVVARNGKLAPDARHPDDTGKEDVVALDPSEEVVISRRFRTFVGAVRRALPQPRPRGPQHDVRLGDRAVSAGARAAASSSPPGPDVRRRAATR